MNNLGTYSDDEEAAAAAHSAPKTASHQTEKEGGHSDDRSKLPEAQGPRTDLQNFRNFRSADGENKEISLQDVRKEFGRLAIDDDRSRYVSNRFWTTLGDEVFCHQSFSYIKYKTLRKILLYLHC